MRRKLIYSCDAASEGTGNSITKLGTLPAGSYHVHSEGGNLFIGSTNWKRYAFINESSGNLTDTDFTLDKDTPMLLQVQNKTTCRNIAVESKTMHDIAVGGGFRASSPRRRLNTDAIEAGDRR